MNSNQGYFSIIQYSEMPERAEFVNIGIALFSVEAPFVLTKFGRRPRRVQTAFNVYLGPHFDLLQDSLRNRLSFEFSKGWRKESVEAFVGLRSGKLRLSPLRSVLVKNSYATLDQLFQELVGEVRVVGRRPRARAKLASAFRNAGVDGLLRKPDPVRLANGIKIDAPFGYQNGSFNLIQAVSLSGDPDTALTRASPHMIEGSLLFRESFEEKRLVVVGDDADEQEPGFIEMLGSQMTQHQVRFYTIDAIEPLVTDIRANYLIHKY